MLTSREKLVAKAEKKKRKIENRLRRKLRKSALRLVGKEIKKSVRQGSTYVHTYVSLIGYGDIGFPFVKHTMSEVVSILENKGFNVTRHERISTFFDGPEYVIVIDLTKKPKNRVEVR
ncbi:hypothetical protein [Bacillus phage SDFMU_Pbc]|uniref:Uncharacterized protein n=1 Tax=Bacillus phage SDFMU_Pbc TaxID=3076135 RepID=A0AA96KRD1_9CAUD|nr:hypothetical protein [Bacillus phage SDFMU_Pbc]